MCSSDLPEYRLARGEPGEDALAIGLQQTGWRQIAAGCHFYFRSELKHIRLFILRYGKNNGLAIIVITHQQKVTAICQYQPDLGLSPALCFYIENTEQAINPLELQAFANTLTCQLVQVTNPPNLKKPGLLVMDMDSTAITIECIDILGSKRK